MKRDYDEHAKHGHDIFLLATIDDAASRMQYTYRCQEKAADKYNSWESCRRTISIVCTVLTAGTLIAALSLLLPDEKVGALVNSALATVSALTATIGDVLNFPEKRAAHSEAGFLVRQVFIAYENLRADYLSGALTADEAREERNQILTREYQLLAKIPRTTRFDYIRADKSINESEKTSENQEAARKTL